MNKKHLPDQRIDFDDSGHTIQRWRTVCGYECTYAEYRRMLLQHKRNVNCKKCLEELGK